MFKKFWEKMKFLNIGISETSRVSSEISNRNITLPRVEFQSVMAGIKPKLSCINNGLGSARTNSCMTGNHAFDEAATCRGVWPSPFCVVNASDL